MNATAHTPGPWEWDKEASALYSADDLAKQREAKRTEAYDHFATAIVETDGGQYGPNGADIALITAAPDMLAAAKIGHAYMAKMLETVKHSDDPALRGAREDFAKVETAISKAEGRS